MPSTDLLKQFGLSRNPFTDRTAEKTRLDTTSLYIHSDLQGFYPSATTYVFFGRRGSGKTTIRMQMQDAYAEYNEKAVASGQSKGHFMVDLSKPSHLTACLRNFQQAIGCTDDNWDAQFADNWSSADMVDCILSFAVTELVDKMSNQSSAEGRSMLEKIQADPRASKQMLLLSHLYARTDSASLAALRAALLRSRYTAMEVAVGAAVAGTVATGAAAALKQDSIQSSLSNSLDDLYRLVPVVRHYPRVVAVTALVSTMAGTSYFVRQRRVASINRAESLVGNIRIAKPQPTRTLAKLLNQLFTSQDKVDTVRSICIGISAHQKLELLSNLVKLLGYESVAVFGDCFDEVGLLDPVQYPGAMKAFAREVCRNDLLNFGRLHFFFPDSRLSLDLNTDKTLKEARFDRHFVRDLTWSRHQLEELAERRFIAAQRAAMRQQTSPGDAFPHADGAGEGAVTSFSNLFKKVRVEDFSSYLAKLHTPRELMIMMTEMMARIEANPEGGLTAQDMEIAVTKALEQAV